MPAGSAYNVDAVLEVMIDGLRAEIDERERAVDDAFAGRGDDARPRAARGVESGLSKSKLQKLWMFNMGYEHHEQPPIYFGSARRSFTPVI